MSHQSDITDNSSRVELSPLNQKFHFKEGIKIVHELESKKQELNHKKGVILFNINVLMVSICYMLSKMIYRRNPLIEPS